MENTDQAMWTAPRPEPGTATMGRGGAPGRMRHTVCVCVYHCACVSRYSATTISSNVIIQNSSLVVTTMSDEITGHKAKVQLTLEQATKAQRGSRGIALLFL